MILTGAFFAEYARVSNDMVDVIGGVWDTCTVPASAPVLQCHLVALLQCGPDDMGRDAEAVLEVIDPAGRQVVHQRGLPVPGTDLTGENRVWVLPMQMHCASPGRHSFILDIDGSQVSVPLTIRIA